jgi:hypothetical protein
LEKGRELLRGVRKMKRRLALATLLFLVWTLVFGDLAPEKQPQPQYTVAVRGVSVVGRPYEGEVLEGVVPETTVLLEVTSAAENIIRFRPGLSEIDLFRDDKGGDLLGKKRPVPIGPPGFAGSPDVLDRGGLLTLQITSPWVPGPGSASLVLKGAFAIEVGADEETVEHRAVPLRAGSAIEVGQHTFTIEDCTPGERPDYEIEIEISGPAELLEIRAVEFVDAKGQPIASDRIETVLGLGTRDRARATYALQREVESATIRITYWSGRETIRVPFDLTIGLSPDVP